MDSSNPTDRAVGALAEGLCNCGIGAGLLYVLLQDEDCPAIVVLGEAGNLLWANPSALSGSWQLFSFADGKLLVAHDEIEEFIGQAIQKSGTTRYYHRSGTGVVEVSCYSHRDDYLDSWMVVVVFSTMSGQDQELFSGLTPSECKLVNSLEQTHCLKTSAAQLKISYENARTKLKHVFDKLNVHSQHELLDKTAKALDVNLNG